MKKPEALIQLIEELRAENTESTVETVRESKAVVYPHDEAEAAEDGITLNRQDCQLIFATPLTAERFLEALGDPEDASLALFDVTVPTEVLDLLEKRFVAVDEG